MLTCPNLLPVDWYKGDLNLPVDPGAALRMTICTASPCFSLGKASTIKGTAGQTGRYVHRQLGQARIFCGEDYVVGERIPSITPPCFLRTSRTKNHLLYLTLNFKLHFLSLCWYPLLS